MSDTEAIKVVLSLSAVGASARTRTMSEDLEKHILRKYEIAQKLGKGVSHRVGAAWVWLWVVSRGFSGKLPGAVHRPACALVCKRLGGRGGQASRTGSPLLPCRRQALIHD